MHTISDVYRILMDKLRAAIKPVMETTETTIQVISQSAAPRHMVEKILHGIPVLGHFTSGAVYAYRTMKYITMLLIDMQGGGAFSYRTKQKRFCSG